MEFFTGWLFYALIACLLGIGGYFTLRFAGVQIRALPHSVAMLWKKADQEGISPFQALTVGLSTRVGTGNIIGIAVALTLGGSGEFHCRCISADIWLGTRPHRRRAGLAERSHCIRRYTLYQPCNERHRTRGGLRVPDAGYIRCRAAFIRIAGDDQFDLQERVRRTAGRRRAGRLCLRSGVDDRRSARAVFK